MSQQTIITIGACMFNLFKKVSKFFEDEPSDTMIRVTIRTRTSPQQVQTLKLLNYINENPTEKEEILNVIAKHINAGAFINGYDSLTNPLHAALKIGNTLLIEALLEAGADPDVLLNREKKSLFDLADKRINLAGLDWFDKHWFDKKIFINKEAVIQKLEESIKVIAKYSKNYPQWLEMKKSAYIRDLKKYAMLFGQALRDENNSVRTLPLDLMLTLCKMLIEKDINAKLFTDSSKMEILKFYLEKNAVLDKKKEASFVKQMRM